MNSFIDLNLFIDICSIVLTQELWRYDHFVRAIIQDEQPPSNQTTPYPHPTKYFDFLSHMHQAHPIYIYP